MDLRKKKITATLVFPIKGDKVLLARKTRKIGMGLWNGWGGMVEEGETIRQTASREFVEESGIRVKDRDLEYVGEITFHNQKADGRRFDVEVHMFLLKKWTGKVKSNSEMRDPTFWEIDKLPFEEMMPSDSEWLGTVLTGEWISGEVWHGLDQKTIIKPTLLKKVKKLRNIG